MAVIADAGGGAGGLTKRKDSSFSSGVSLASAAVLVDARESATLMDVATDVIGDINIMKESKHDVKTLRLPGEGWGIQRFMALLEAMASIMPDTADEG